MSRTFDDSLYPLTFATIFMMFPMMIFMQIVVHGMSNGFGRYKLSWLGKEILKYAPKSTKKTQKTPATTLLKNTLKKTLRKSSFGPFWTTSLACKSLPPVAPGAPSPQTPLPFVARLLPAPSTTLKACFPESRPPRGPAHPLLLKLPLLLIHGI